MYNIAHSSLFNFGRQVRSAHAPRVLIVRTYYASRPGAVSTSVDNLGKALRSSGYECSVLALPDPSRPTYLPQEKLPGAAVIKSFEEDGVVAKLLFWLAAGIRLIRVRRSVDVVITVDTPPGVGYLGRMVRSLTRGRILHVNWIMDLFALQRVRLLGRAPNLRERVLHRVERAALHGDAESVVLGECMREKLSDMGLRSHVIPLAVEPPLPSAVSNSRSLSRAAADSGKFILFYGGHAGPRSPLSPVLDAARDLGGEVVIRVVGFGPDIDQLVAAPELLPDNVVLEGRVSDSEYRTLAEQADVHLVSLAETATGTSVPSKTYSAMALGKPVLYIGDPQGQAAQDIQRSGAGMVVKPRANLIVEALDRMRNDPSLRMMGDAGREFVLSERSVEAIGREWSRIFGLDRARASVD